MNFENESVEKKIDVLNRIIDKIDEGLVQMDLCDRMLEITDSVLLKGAEKKIIDDNKLNRIFQQELRLQTLREINELKKGISTIE